MFKSAKNSKIPHLKKGPKSDIKSRNICKADRPSYSLKVTESTNYNYN